MGGVWLSDRTLRWKYSGICCSHRTFSALPSPLPLALGLGLTHDRIGIRSADRTDVRTVVRSVRADVRTASHCLGSELNGLVGVAVCTEGADRTCCFYKSSNSDVDLGSDSGYDFYSEHYSDHYSDHYPDCYFDSYFESSPGDGRIPSHAFPHAVRAVRSDQQYRHHVSEIERDSYARDHRPSHQSSCSLI
jgi:hypothetical protein